MGTPPNNSRATISPSGARDATSPAAAHKRR